MHELAWLLQSHDVDPQNCEAIARHASQIYALSVTQAFESSRTLKLAEALDQAGGRLASILDTIVHELQVDVAGHPAA